jgi:hypothetical protein
MYGLKAFGHVLAVMFDLPENVAGGGDFSRLWAS